MSIPENESDISGTSANTSVLESPLVGSSENSIFDYNNVTSQESSSEASEDITRVCRDNGDPSTSVQFEDWFDKDIEAESAEEETEESSYLVDIDALSNKNDVLLDPTNQTMVTRITELLNDAIDDDDHHQPMTSSRGVSRTLTEDDDLFSKSF